ncbi:MAG TPA: Calx-beta domain-containing protein, partial [Pyrinomonadaceae bacterium]
MKYLPRLITDKQALARRPFYLVLLATLSAIAILPCWQRVTAAGGDLDPTFGGSGLVFVRPQAISGNGPATAAALQPDGKIVVVTSLSGPIKTALMRLNTDGSIDSSFGDSNGRAPADSAVSIALQQDGKIVTAGTVEYTGTTEKPDLLVSRYNADGSPDTSFGTGGRVKTDFLGRQDSASAVIIQPDQKIVVAAVANTGEFSNGKEGTVFAIARYDSTGALDTSFGTGGKVTTIFPGRFSLARDIIFQPDWKLVVVGKTLSRTSTVTEDDFALARYYTDGTLDATFGAGGMVTKDVSPSDDAYTVAIQADRRLLVGGTAGNPLQPSEPNNAALLRYNSDGTPDSTFGVGGYTAFDLFGRKDRIEKILIQSDARFIVVGDGLRTPDSENTVWALARHNPDGTRDQTFHSGEAVLTFNASGELPVRDALLQPDGKIVVIGERLFFEFGSMGAAGRYLNDGGTPMPALVPDPLPTLPPITLQFSQAGYTVAEATGFLNVTVVRGGNASVPASVKYATGDQTDANFKCDPYTPGQATIYASRKCDYHIASGTLRFAAGELAKQFTLSFTDDTYVEGPESLTLTLSNPVGATLGENSSANVTITDNDVFGLPNPVDNTRFFVRQLYVDLLSREPDPAGWNGWTDRINLCGQPGQPPPPCDRVTVAGDGFL